MSVAPGAMALLGMLMTSDQPAEEEVEDTPAPRPAEFWTDADIADSASTSITGTNVDSFVGYTAASTGAVADPISNFAAGRYNSGTINLSAVEIITFNLAQPLPGALEARLTSALTRSMS